MSSVGNDHSDKVVSSVSSALKAVWWIPLIRGIFLVILGLLLMMEPLTTLASLIWVFGGFLLLDGITVMIQGFANRGQIGWKWWLVQGALDIVIAGMIMLWPAITATALLYLLLVWTIVLGIAAIIGAAALQRSKDLSWPWMLTFGLMSLLFGATLLARGFNGLAPLSLLAVVFGIYAAIMGAVQIVSAFSVRATAKDIDEALRGNSAVLEAIIERRVAKAQEDSQRAAANEADKAAAQAEKDAAQAEKDAEKAAAHAQKDADKAEAHAQKEAEKAAAKAEKRAAKDAPTEPMTEPAYEQQPPAVPTYDQQPPAVPPYEQQPPTGPTYEDRPPTF